MLKLQIIVFSCNIAFRKKIDTLSKEKECELAGEWKKSMINHLYWPAVSTPDGGGDLIQEKWVPLDKHIHDWHKKQSLSLHANTRQYGRKEKWCKPRKYVLHNCMYLCIQMSVMFYTVDTKVSEKVSAIIQNKAFCRDVMKLSPQVPHLYLHVRRSTV